MFLIFAIVRKKHVKPAKYPIIFKKGQEMKKLIPLILFALLGLFGKVSAGGSYDLKFSDSIVGVVNGDTAQTGFYQLRVWVENSGPDVYSGPINLNVWIGKPTSVFDTDHPTLTYTIDSLVSAVYTIPPGKKILIKKKIKIDKYYYNPESGNIVIIWPSGAFKGTSTLVDKNASNNFCKSIKFFLTTTPTNPSIITSVNSGSQSLENSRAAFAAYPNPVRQQLYINFGSDKSSLINLYNLQGQLVAQESFKGALVSQPFALKDPSGNPLGAGFYTLVCTSGNTRQTLKVMIIE